MKTILLYCYMIWMLSFSFFNELNAKELFDDQTGSLKVGWSNIDITPDRPILLAGQFHARLSEGILDSITATALALESIIDNESIHTILVSCDLINIGDSNRESSYGNLLERVRTLVTQSIPEIKPLEIVLNATHTHTAPLASDHNTEKLYGIGLELISNGKSVMKPSEYLDFAALRIADAIKEAWGNRKPGGISYGLSHAVIGHNRMQALMNGKSIKRGNLNHSEFSHIEGYEDHSVNVLYTWSQEEALTGVVINVAIPSQVSGSSYLISADFWHDTRIELRKRLSENLFVLPQTGSGGDQSPHIMVGDKAESRMQHVLGLDRDGKRGNGTIARRKQIAFRLSDAVTSIYPYMKNQVEWSPLHKHKAVTLQLSRRLISSADVENAENESLKWGEEYHDMLKQVETNPEISQERRWYRDITRSYKQLRRGEVVKERYEIEKKSPKIPIEVHVLRIGDIVMATNPFELYLDYGIRMKARSPAVQTFIIQLAGSGTYLPTKRSIEGGAYGAVPASTLVGSEGGQELVERTLKLINELWE